jgi:hypothetical protein
VPETRLARSWAEWFNHSVIDLKNMSPEQVVARIKCGTEQELAEFKQSLYGREHTDTYKLVESTIQKIVALKSVNRSNTHHTEIVETTKTSMAPIVPMANDSRIIVCLNWWLLIIGVLTLFATIAILWHEVFRGDAKSANPQGQPQMQLSQPKSVIGAQK